MNPLLFAEPPRITAAQIERALVDLALLSLGRRRREHFAARLGVPASDPICEACETQAALINFQAMFAQGVVPFSDYRTAAWAIVAGAA